MDAARPLDPDASGRAAATASAPHAVLVVGVPRGGTTWVGRALGATDRAAYVHEPDGTHDPYGFVAKRDQLFHPILEPGASAPTYERLWAGAFEGGAPRGTVPDRIARRLYARVSPEEKHRARLGDASWRMRVVARFATPLGPRPGCAHVVVKSVNAALSADWIAQRFPVDVAVVTRHPLNVAASWRDFGWQSPNPTLYDAVATLARNRWGVVAPAADAAPIERATLLSASLAARLDDALHAHPEWVHIDHETVCGDPLAQFRSAADRLGLVWSDAATEFVAESDRPGSGYGTQRVAHEQRDRWRTRLSADEVEQACGVLRRFPHAAHWDLP